MFRKPTLVLVFLYLFKYLGLPHQSIINMANFVTQRNNTKLNNIEHHEFLVKKSTAKLGSAKNECFDRQVKLKQDSWFSSI